MRSVLACLLLTACNPTTPPPATPATPAEHHTAAPPPVNAHDKWKERPADAGCNTSLSQLVGGQLDTFKGFNKCGRVDAEAVLGSSGDQPSKFEQFGEYRVYPHTGGSVLVWFLADDIRVMQFLYPKLKRPIRSLIGEPESKVVSRLSPEWDQWVYARRGLTAHVKRTTGDVVTLFAYPPTTVEEFLKTDIAHVAKSEAPLEELK
jgi:hypothetical protein